MTKEVAVLICAHNEEKYIAETISSVLNQSFQNFDLLISENYSTDSTLEIIKDFQKHDDRILCIKPDSFCRSMENGRFLIDRVNCMNYGSNLFLGAHDVVSHRYVELLHDAYLNNPSASVISGSGIEIDSSGNPLRAWPPITQLKGGHTQFRWMATLFTVFYNVAAFGLWPHRLRRDVKIRHDCMCGDHLYLAEASLHGDIIVESEAVIYTRRTEGVGDISTYFQKHISDDMHLKSILIDLEKQFEWVAHICNSAFSGFAEVQKNIILAGALGNYFIMYVVPTLSSIDGAMDLWLSSPSGLAIASKLNSVGVDIKESLQINNSTNFY